MSTATPRHFENIQPRLLDGYYTNGTTRDTHYNVYALITPEQLYLVYMVFGRGLINILCLWGLFGNVITVLVLIKQGLKDTINILLTSIAVFDTVFCFTQLVQEVIPILREYDPEAAGKFLIIYMLGINQWNHLALTSSIYNVAIIGVERLIAVCFPFLVARICTPHRTKCLIVLTEVFIFTFTFPEKFLLHEYIWQNNQIIQVGRSWVTSANTNLMFYWTYLIPLVQVILPLCVLIVCYSVIVVMLQTSFTKTSNLASNITKSKRLKELKMFRLLLTLMTVAFISFLPAVVMTLTLSSKTYDFYLDLYSMQMVQILVKVFSHLFPSMNFIIYVKLSSKFAATYRSLMKGVLVAQLGHGIKRLCGMRTKEGRLV